MGWTGFGWDEGEKQVGVDFIRAGRGWGGWEFAEVGLEGHAFDCPEFAKGALQD